MEIDNEVPDPPSMENISEENAFEPISVAVDEIAFDHSLRDEYDRGDGDLEIVCEGDGRIICHSCIVECQSRIMRRSIVRKSQDGLLLPRAQLSCPKFSIFQMRKLLGIMYPSQHAVFNSLNEMIEILIVAAFYDISWIVKSVEKAMLDLLPENEDQLREQKVAQATRCRDILLVLQENVQFSDENPNPNYKPFDTAFESITASLLAKLAAFANDGIIPEPLDPVSITNLVASQLEDENHGRQIDPSESLMIFLAYCFKESFERDPDQNLSNKIFHEVVRRNSVLQQTLVNLIPEIVRNRPAAPPAAPINNPPPPQVPPRANVMPNDNFIQDRLDRFRRAREVFPRRFGGPRGPLHPFGRGPLDDGPDNRPGNDDPNNPPPGRGRHRLRHWGRDGVEERIMATLTNFVLDQKTNFQSELYKADAFVQPIGGAAPNPPAAQGAVGGGGDGNQHQDRLERQMARARQRLQARAESLDRLRQRQRELLYPNWANPIGSSPAEVRSRRQNEMKKWSDENKAKYTAKVESVEKMKDKEPATKVRQQAEKTLEKLKIALKSINKSAKCFETKEFRELIEPYLKLQSRLQSLVNSLDFNTLDKELPFSKQKSTTGTSDGNATDRPMDREAQIAADREFALTMARSLNENHPNGTQSLRDVMREQNLKDFHDKLEQERLRRFEKDSNNSTDQLVAGPITKKRKLSGENSLTKQSRENKVKSWLAAQPSEPSEKKKPDKNAESSGENADVKTDPEQIGERLCTSLNTLADQAMRIMNAGADQNNTVKIEVDDGQPIVVDQSDDDDVILSNIDFNMQPGPSGLNSKPGNKKD